MVKSINSRITINKGSSKCKKNGVQMLTTTLEDVNITETFINSNIYKVLNGDNEQYLTFTDTSGPEPIYYEIYNIEFERIKRGQTYYKQDILPKHKQIIKDELRAIYRSIINADDKKFIDHMKIYDKINSMYNKNIFLFYRDPKSNIYNGALNGVILSCFDYSRQRSKNDNIHEYIPNRAILKDILDILQHIGLISALLEDE